MITLADLTQKALSMGKITAELEKQIDTLMWSSTLDLSDLIALEKLVEMLSTGNLAIE